MKVLGRLSRHDPSDWVGPMAGVSPTTAQHVAPFRLFPRTAAERARDE